MADFSPNKRLELPKSNEKYDVGVANKNNMVIDSELHKLELKNQSQDKLLATKEELNSKISNTTTKLNTEISRAKSSENELSNSIENEINRAVTTERDIINELDNRVPFRFGIDASGNYGYYRIDTGEFVKIQGVSPIVKETIFKIKNRDLKVFGINGSSQTDITDIVIKAYNTSVLDEGMRLGISSNGMGYIQAQNFVLDCSDLTSDEAALLQSFYSIKFSKENNSSNFPILRPATQDFAAEVVVSNKNTRTIVTTKLKILSNDNENFFQYDLPSEFRNNDNPNGTLKLETKEWTVAMGIDIKNRNWKTNK